MWLGFAPFALVIGVIPGRGHEFFRGWLSHLAGYLLRKVIYSAILAVVLAVCGALADATSNLGWLMAFALQALFLWAVFLQRDRIAGDLLAATAGRNAARDGVSRLQTLYYTTRLARMAGLHRHRTNAAATNRGHGPDAAVPPSPPPETPAPSETPPRGLDVPEPGDDVDAPIGGSEGGATPALPEPESDYEEPIVASEAPLPIPAEPRGVEVPEPGDAYGEPGPGKHRLASTRPEWQAQNGEKAPPPPPSNSASDPDEEPS
jgi:hypothetical protein